METIVREYTVDSHNDMCAAGQCLGLILKELLGDEFVTLSGFIDQTIKLNGADSAQSDKLRIKLNGTYRSNDFRGGYVSHSGFFNEQGGYDQRRDGTGRKICNVWVETIEDGWSQKPYKYRIGIEWESKEDFLEKCRISTSYRNLGDVVRWHEVKVGDRISAWCPPDGPSLVVEVTAVGRSKFMGIPYGSDEEIAYLKEDDWRYHEV